MIIYPEDTQPRTRQALEEMTKDQLWDVIGIFCIPTYDRPYDHDWEHKELRQRIVDWLYDPSFKVKRHG